MKYNKLVRDKIPEIIRKNGDEPVTHIASDREYLSKLKDTLEDKVAEFRKNTEADELVDILEVLYALSAYLGSSPKSLERARKQKASERGGYSEGIILEETVE